jgi:hypothetical protein
MDEEHADIDKRSILDLCAHIFHPDSEGHDLSKGDHVSNSADEFIMSYEVGEFNDMRVEDRIKEFENEQADLIFECFCEEAVLFK